MKIRMILLSILLMLLSSYSVSALSWYNSSFNYDVTVVDDMFKWYSDGFGYDVTVNEQPSYIWYNSRFSYNVTVNNYSENNSGYVISSGTVYVLSNACRLVML